MTAIQILQEEHAVILEAIDLLERHACEVRAGGEIDREFAGWIAQFLHEFAEGTHHAKEEGALFELLEKHGMSRESGCLADTLRAHVAQQALLAEYEGCMRHGDGPSFAAVSLRLVGQLRQLIVDENAGLFAEAERLMTPEDDRAALQAFGRLVHEREGVLIRMRHLAAISRWRTSIGSRTRSSP